MNKHELEVIADEIAEAINQGRFHEATMKFSETFFLSELYDLFKDKVGQYDLQRFDAMVHDKQRRDVASMGDDE